MMQCMSEDGNWDKEKQWGLGITGFSTGHVKLRKDVRNVVLQ